jgi:RHH-type proline utilization regulon transcriptional repressor/proline dehydrogenase/delta 1-pyrroline-5-carboxylate dehydrogenase
MLIPPELDTSPCRQRIRELARSGEEQCVRTLLADGGVPKELRSEVERQAAALVGAIRKRQHHGANVNALLNEYSLTSKEGVMLMCLAEALLRVPDKLTIDRLIRDKLGGGDWHAHLGHGHSLFVNASAWGLLLTGRFIEFQKPGGEGLLAQLEHLLGRVGEPAIRAAMQLAMRIMGTQFVLGRDIGEAIDRSGAWQAKGYRYTYDMLGEAARTGDYAREYFDSYCAAIERVGAAAGSQSPVTGPGFSIKLSALHPRYEVTHMGRLRNELAPRILALAQLARKHNLGLTIDAEEAHRVDPMLELFEQVFADHSLRGWEGFGVAVQTYLKNATAVIDWLEALSQTHHKKIMVRLVKGAYWDAEIKLAQTLGYANYPVFTRKSASDLAYLVAAGKLLTCRDLLYPQFATHNAHSVAAILRLAGDTVGYEFQRLHGMGEELYDELIANQGVPAACRIYSPVGVHKDLLAYLVRRLLENGANSSFVHKLADEAVPDARLADDPAKILAGFRHLSNPGIALPVDVFGADRTAAAGVDLADIDQLDWMAAGLAGWRDWIRAPGCEGAIPGALAVVDPANRHATLGYYVASTGAEMEQALEQASQALPDWSGLPATDRAAIMRRTADLLEARCVEMTGFCVKEAGKTLRDSLADVREAIDFCRYYAQQAELLQPDTGDTPAPLGVVLCISPWNFPVAIFVGQVCAALVTGNTVLAKPAEQTTLTALRIVELFREAGLPPAVLQLLLGPGEPVGERVLPDPRIAGVMFTGSTEVARYIAQTLAARTGVRVPLIAETGGQNVMVVDSTALIEKVVDDVISSGFNSAGQRCSALRVLFVQDEIAEPLIAMLVGAMKELQIGDPAALATDVGPIIDATALARLRAHEASMAQTGRVLYQCDLGSETGKGLFFAPTLYELASIDQLPDEVFGPVVHLIRYPAHALDSLPAKINSTDYGLTFGVHSRIESTIDRLSGEIDAGNIYVNRNIIGAVVGMQPFGGRGLSGTGPKAGGPHYLQRLVRQRGKVATAPDQAASVAAVPAAQGALEWSEDLAKLNKVFHSWRATSKEQRLDCVRELQRALASRTDLDSAQRDASVAILERLVQQGAQVVKPVEFVGPTGESNSLYLESRGVLVCLLPAGVELPEILAPVVASLLAGNPVLLLTCADGLAMATLVDYLVGRAGFAANALVVRDHGGDQCIEDCLRRGAIAGAVTSGQGPLALLASRSLAEREGAILPLIDDDFGPGYLTRFFYEKTISVNTTASGGNAALMSLEELD